MSVNIAKRPMTFRVAEEDQMSWTRYYTVPVTDVVFVGEGEARIKYLPAWRKSEALNTVPDMVAPEHSSLTEDVDRRSFKASRLRGSAADG
ncbi:hypothetical protein HG530_010830 [Fusarium avenaceum]|nr:hypothetical protein HG530_010830 [Fusarium avenaceum]